MSDVEQAGTLEALPEKPTCYLPGRSEDGIPDGSQYLGRRREVSIIFKNKTPPQLA